jgi:NAD(P)-dependent dehydrogenase (short-subunit alcohol dehydrogenase family)
MIIIWIDSYFVFVTLLGCDSGFGFEVAKHLTRLGFKVFAGCLRKNQRGQGAKDLVLTIILCNTYLYQD